MAYVEFNFFFTNIILIWIGGFVEIWYLNKGYQTLHRRSDINIPGAKFNPFLSRFLKNLRRQKNLQKFMNLRNAFKMLRGLLDIRNRCVQNPINYLRSNVCGNS